MTEHTSYRPSPADALALFEHSSDGILILDRRGVIVFVNAQVERLFRRKASAMLNENFWTLSVGARTAEGEEVLQRAIGQRVAGRFEMFHPGLYAWHAVTAVPMTGGAGLFVRDVTDRMRLLRDEAVRQGIANVVATIPVAISTTNGPDHRFEIVNAFAREMLQGRDVVGMTLRNAFPELVEQGFADLFDRVYSSGEPYRATELEVEYRRGTDTGLTKGIFDVVYQPVRDLNGEIVGVLSVSVDTTEQVKARRQVEAMVREREAVLEQLREGVIIADRSGRIRYVNEVARELHGRVALDIMPGDYADAYELLTEGEEPYAPSELPLARAVAERAAVRNARWKIRRPDGSVVLVEGDATPVTNVDGSPAGAVLTMHVVAVPGERGAALA